MLEMRHRAPETCTHPAIVQREDGHWYCTECGSRVA